MYSRLKHLLRGSLATINSPVLMIVAAKIWRVHYWVYHIGFTARKLQNWFWKRKFVSPIQCCWTKPFMEFHGRCLGEGAGYHFRLLNHHVLQHFILTSPHLLHEISILGFLDQHSHHECTKFMKTRFSETNIYTHHNIKSSKNI